MVVVVGLKVAVRGGGEGGRERGDCKGVWAMVVLVVLRVVLCGGGLLDCCC